MRGWIKQGRNTRRATAAKGAARAKISADLVADAACAEAQRISAMRFNAATLMLNRAMSEYAEEGARR